MIFRGLFFSHNAEIGQKDHLWTDTSYNQLKPNWITILFV